MFYSRGLTFKVELVTTYMAFWGHASPRKILDLYIFLHLAFTASNLILMDAI